MAQGRPIRIVSDGTWHGTHVYDSAGNEIQHVTEIVFRGNLRGAPEVTITVYGVEVDLVGFDRIEGFNQGDAAAPEEELFGY